MQFVSELSFLLQWAPEQAAATPALPSAIGGGEDWGSTGNWGTETSTSISKDWADMPSEPAPKEWGAEPSGDWGTSITMQDANSGGAEWA